MHRLLRAWRTIRALSWSQRWLTTQAWLLMLLTAAVLRLLGFRWAHALAKPARAPSAAVENLASAEALADMVHAAARWTPVRTTCLAQSIVLCRILRQRRLSASLRIGVARPGGRFAAHAWVEHAGVALNESPDVDRCFAPFDGCLLPGAGDDQ